MSDTLSTAVDEVVAEAAKAQDLYGSFASAHEMLGVLLEEVEELKAHVYQRQGLRNLQAMRKEAIQVAAIALRWAAACECDGPELRR